MGFVAGAASIISPSVVLLYIKMSGLPTRGDVERTMNVSITILMKVPNFTTLQPIGKRLADIECKLESTMFLDVLKHPRR